MDDNCALLGWTVHPDNPAFYYKGDKVITAAQLAERQKNREGHRAAQKPGKVPQDKITSSQHPAIGDKADPALLSLMQAAQAAAEGALPGLFSAAAREVIAPADAPTHSKLMALQKTRAISERDIRELAKGISASCILQLAVIAHDPLQLGPTRVSAAAHLVERAHGKPTNMLSPLKENLADMTAKDACDAIFRAGQAGEISLEEIKVLLFVVERRSQAGEAAELLDRMSALEKLLDGTETIPQPRYS